MSLKLLTGNVISQRNRFISVKLHGTGQIITNVVIANKIDLDEREQQPNIKIGAEVLMLSDGLSNVFAINSISQAIKLLGKKVYRIENDEVQIYSPLIKLMDSTGDNDDTEEVISGLVDVWTNKMKIRNDTVELVDNLTQTQQQLIDLANTVASLKAIVTKGSSAGSYSHSGVSGASSVSSKVTFLKSDLLTLKE